jgi:hypothetical protein
MIMLLLLLVFVSMVPLTQAKISSAWESVRPVVVESMDSLYAVVHDFVAGNHSHHQIHENPQTPPADFDVIITMKNTLPL